MENKEFYISLTRGLTGYYVKVLATDEDVAREYASNYFDHNWCSVYMKEDIERFREKPWKTIVINENDPIVLNDCPRYE